MKMISKVLLFVITLSGLFLAGGGGWLVILGGSLYYLFAGIIYLLSVYFILRRRKIGIYCIYFVLVFSILWAIWERGFLFWPFFSRSLVPLALTILATCLLNEMRPLIGVKEKRMFIAGGLAATMTFFSIFIGAFFPHDAQYGDAAVYKKHPENNKSENWYAYGRSTHGTRFSPFTQINRENIKSLHPVWQYRTGDLGPGIDQNTPLQIDHFLYSCSRNGVIAALDVDTGKATWTFDANERSPIWQRCRGLGYYEAPKVVKTQQQPERSTCSERIIQTTNTAKLIALDAKTGLRCAGFGHGGTVDLKQGMGEVKPGFYFQTSAPLVAGNKIVVGGWVVDNQEVGEPSGVIRAFDAETGELAWAWDLGNPAIDRLPPPGESYTRGTPNMWSTAAYDEKLGLVYIPLGNTTPDYYGVLRTELENKYNSSLVALDVNTGKERWHYQTVHRDIWDYDLPSQPALVDVPDEKGNIVAAVMQTTKRGEIFLLNRETGEPITAVEEKAVPTKSTIPGEVLSPTQPYSVGMPSVRAGILSENKIWGATLFDQLACRIEFKQSVYQGDFTPIGLKKAIQYPSNLGGLNWGSVSVDPKNNIAYVNDVRVPVTYWLIKRNEYPEVEKKYHSDHTGHGPSAQTGTPYGMVTTVWTSAAGIPCVEPPFGTLTAVDLNSRKIAWQVPVGTTEELGPFGIKSHLPMPMGLPTYAGNSTTAGGVVFFAGSQDYYLRAYDAATGKEIWKYPLPVGASATPMTYISPKTSKQYVVVSVGGAAHSQDIGDYVIAFSL
ncbi:membrane-bound PQQ-dependent dehydrogenase, glucose/quinate/shikimate family [Serratia sp. BIGb0163]|uniref:membrane-bound PQQ-dependent dehydrogenase, glucose/quinate/shikimate family n=1 Tax=Serratia sp. BIGb0163 TaxID=2940613 RepID=UPI00216726DC|nr:membrane-bound PQQ-dependent dehydrogenase, glucose/quinate/shikimate family [Serratia sp. BIGb0163]MCS4266481.1 quinate dehydrogenase (quinone) [Serratia sp. BIGb0163]